MSNVVKDFSNQTFILLISHRLLLTRINFIKNIFREIDKLKGSNNSISLYILLILHSF